MADYLSGAITSFLSTEVMSGVWQQLLADRNALPSHPALWRVPAPPGSATVRVPETALEGYTLLAQVDDGSAVSATAITQGEADVVLKRYAKRYDVSTFAQMIEPAGIISAQRFALDALMASGATIRDLHANLVDNFATTSGTSGVDMSAADYLDAITALEVNANDGPFLCMLHPTQFGDLRKDVSLNSGGAIQWNAGSQGVMDAMKGLGYQGNLLGVDVFTTTSVVSDGTNRKGGMFARGALVYAVSRPIADPDLPQIVLGDEVLFEKDRNADTGVTEYVSHLHVGILEGIDLKGVTIATDA